jgi:hypothetical protein
MYKFSSTIKRTMKTNSKWTETRALKKSKREIVLKVKRIMDYEYKRITDYEYLNN